ncbi:flagellar protein export ATPase FliI [Campylobacter insulaenigrae]|uniref:Flagellar export apparatus, flagellum-specific ATP synthase FliI n=2 Tax=Campylobacter insulaenigrae TaxID=260714 RepID=A0A0A8H627_9BACT|nr:flagellar protein export ATPase FliI [Campylobacter insulaenigrae]AJC88369.1 flagellar export apparatus, flagellum-specific ATP synthase FliI [Campylobacter insulaenigrae NCTC 12927]MCR6571356.1 flagellar protein export ATPase FliI [Campylobacter insulaenigrae]MCR6572797.1 flagellar protein export ATPase FliI [Campylobacter insulaenigrae]MCR6574419.1 flagellar protein export ATPase FliI [Campylobacter insulaenigrae]MCR6575772.1 flagellar protein export ATPase FliI [Campylobacter insulaenigr
MALEKLRNKISSQNLSSVFGQITKISSTSIEINGLKTSIGDIIKIVSNEDENKEAMAMVVEVDEHLSYLSPFGFVEGFKIGDRAFINDAGMQIGVSDALLGRVVDPFMRPKDGKAPIEADKFMPIMRAPIDAMKRGLIDEVFPVGVKTIDALLTCGVGQKLGIFAGSGVGKSTLMGMIVKNSKAPIKVIALIGERGREIPEFIQKNLGGKLDDTVIIVATSDDSALMRKYGAFCAMSVAEYFKEQGKDVLFIMDSVTRFAMAQREIGLALGEPPTTKGYPPSVLSLLPQLMERTGKEEGKGTITAFFTVLVDGDDMSDPIADQSRSILDGHIVLSRELTDFGIYPPINIQNSASRVMGDIISDEHKIYARKFKRLNSLLKENEVLLRIGAYQKGSDKELDQAIMKKDFMQQFLSQNPEENFEFEDTINMLKMIES